MYSKIHEKGLNIMNLKLDKSIELKNCTPIKAILAILVVLYHSTAFWGWELVHSKSNL